MYLLGLCCLVKTVTRRLGKGANLARSKDFGGCCHEDVGAGSADSKLSKKSNLNEQDNLGDLPHRCELLELALESLPYPFCLIDTEDYSVKLANTASGFGKLDGSQKCYAMLHKSKRPCNENGEPCPIDTIKATKQPAVVEHGHAGKDGSPRYYEVHGYPVLDPKGEVSNIIEFSLDVTERRMAEEALRSIRAELERRVGERTKTLKVINERLSREVSVRRGTEQALDETEKLHQVILSQISDAVLITDDQARFTYVSPRAGDIFGYSQEEILEMGSVDLLLGVNLFNPDDLEDGKEIHNIKRAVFDKSGLPHTLLVNVRRAIIGGGTTLYTCRDATRLSRAEQALETVNEELQLERETLREKNTALKEILSQIEDEKKRMASHMHLNINRMALPILNALEDKTYPDGEYFVSLLKNCLADITSPFISKLESDHSNLTPRELEICHMVKNGFTSKQVSAALNTSVETVLKQRKMIRRKLGIARKKINLVTHLKSLEYLARK